MSEPGLAALRDWTVSKGSLLLVTLLAAATFAACGKNVEVSAPSRPAATPSATITPPATITPSGSVSMSGGLTTFNGHNVSFSYPAGWQPIPIGQESGSQGTPLWSEAFGVDDASFVLVRQYNQTLAITASNIDQHTSELTAQIQALYTQAGGSMQSGPTKLTMGGFPALGYSGTAVNPSAVSVKDRIVLAFNGTTEYFVNCQSTGTSTSTVDAGCDEIISTFRAS